MNISNLKEVTSKLTTEDVKLWAVNYEVVIHSMESKMRAEARIFATNQAHECDQGDRGAVHRGAYAEHRVYSRRVRDFGKGVLSPPP